VETKQRYPTWPGQKPQNLVIEPGRKIIVELWHNHPVKDQPLCHVRVKNLETMREGGRNEVQCDSGARLWLNVQSARAELGVGLFVELRGADGVRVTKVLKNSPAEREGIREGDRLIRLQGISVAEMDALDVKSKLNVYSRSGLDLEIKSKSGQLKKISVKEGPIYPRGVVQLSEK
ncbi:MAG: PDZ domain-containing protein, partial [Polyangiaceae bacterium]|nr:PDZ domain-containing protein [Polyangiaceae bacterium]